MREDADDRGDEVMGVIEGEHTHLINAGCLAGRLEHCWHPRNAADAINPVVWTQLCCWCAKWRDIKSDYLAQHGPWRAKPPQSEAEVKE